MSAGTRTRAYTQIKGHGLQAEGKPYANNGEGGWMRVHVYDGVGLCSCGATSEVLPSDADRKRWHRDHKNDVIEALTGVKDALGGGRQAAK